MMQQSPIAKQEQHRAHQDGIRLLMPQGIIGFHDLKHYVINPIMNGESLSNFWLLKSHEYQEIAFILLESNAIKERVLLHLSDVAVGASKYGINIQRCELFFVITVDRSQGVKKNTTVNLRAPVLIDFTKKHAWQVILADPKYPIDYSL